MAHSSCLAKGMPATPIIDIPHDQEQKRTLFQSMTPRLQFELKLQDVVTRCSIAVSQNGVRTMSADQERSLDTLLGMFNAQIASVGLEYATGTYFIMLPGWRSLMVLSLARSG